MDKNKVLQYFTNISGVNNDFAESHKELIEMMENPSFYLILLDILCDSNTNYSSRMIAATQLKNIVDNKWNDSRFFSDHIKSIIRENLLKIVCEFSMKQKTCHIILCDTIAKISRHDWNKQWPNLLDYLYEQNEWIAIYKIAKVQASRRYGEGLIIFKNLVQSLVKVIYVDWKDFCLNHTNKMADLTKSPNNMVYQLKTLNVFINHSTLLLDESTEFYDIVCKIIKDIIHMFPNFYEYCSANHLNNNCEYMLCTVIKTILAFAKRSPDKLTSLGNKFENFLVKVLVEKRFELSGKFMLVVMSVLQRYIDCGGVVANDLLTVQVLDALRSSLLVKSDEYVDSIFNNPDSILDELNKSSDSEHNCYDQQWVISAIFQSLLKQFSLHNNVELNRIYQELRKDLCNLPLNHLESYLNLIGYMVASNTSNGAVQPMEIIALIQSILSVVVQQQHHNISNASISVEWIVMVKCRCIWLITKSLVGMDLISGEINQLFVICKWLFVDLLQLQLTTDNHLSVHSPEHLCVHMYTVLFTNHIVGLINTQLSCHLAESRQIHSHFISYSIYHLVMVINLTNESDSHTKLIEILNELLRCSSIWDDLTLIKSVANSIYNVWISQDKTSESARLKPNELQILRSNLLDIMSLLVKSCEAELIQPLLETFACFVLEAFKVPADAPSRDVLMHNTVELWTEVIQKSQGFITHFDSVHTALVSHYQPFILDHDQQCIARTMESVQAHFLLKVLHGMNRQEFYQYSDITWSYLAKLPIAWDGGKQKFHELEQNQLLLIQLYDLWLLGYSNLFKNESPVGLLHNTKLGEIFIDQIHTLYSTTNVEPSTDQNVFITNSLLTLFARICLYDCNILIGALDHLSNGNSTDFQRASLGLLERWLWRLDNQSANTNQQLFVIAAIQWMSSQFNYIFPLDDKSKSHVGLNKQLELLINCCIQTCNNIQPDYCNQRLQSIESIVQPSEKYLHQAYFYWQPLHAYQNNIQSCIISQFHRLIQQHIGLDSFQLMFDQLDSATKTKFQLLVTDSPS